MTERTAYAFSPYCSASTRGTRYVTYGSAFWPSFCYWLVPGTSWEGDEVQP